MGAGALQISTPPANTVTFSASALDGSHNFGGSGISDEATKNSVYFSDVTNWNTDALTISSGTEFFYNYKFGSDRFELQVWNTIPTGSGGSYEVIEVNPQTGDICRAPAGALQISCSSN